MVILFVVGPVDCVSPRYGFYRRVGVRLQYEVTDRHHTGLLQELYAALSCRAQELCESRGGRPGLPVPNKPTVSVDVKQRFINSLSCSVCPLYFISDATSKA